MALPSYFNSTHLLRLLSSYKKPFQTTAGTTITIFKFRQLAKSATATINHTPLPNFF